MPHRSNSPERFPDFSRLFDDPENTEYDEITSQDTQLDLVLSDLNTQVRTTFTPPVHALDAFSTPATILQAITEEKHYIEDCLTGISRYDKPADQRSFLSEIVLPRQIILDELFEKLTIAREIHTNHEPAVRAVFDSITDSK